MKKIVIIGSPGAGKSTFARALGDILGINDEVIHLDRYFWKPGWIEYPRKSRIHIEQNLVAGKDTWIIEGTYLGSSDSRLQIADTIIFLDIPPLTCFYRLIQRHKEWRGLSRFDIPEGCTNRLDVKCLLKVLVFPLKGRRELNKKLGTYSSEKVIRLQSNEEIKVFLAQLKQKLVVASIVPEQQEKYAMAINH